jgi:B12-binding domain/radical SAM domain protein
LKSDLLFFKFNNITKYSIAALIGAIENNNNFSKLEIRVGTLKELFELNVNKYNKIFLAYSFLSTQVNEIKKEINKIRQKFRDRLIIIGGGPHATLKPKSTIKWGFDCLVVGEGELVFGEVLLGFLMADKYSDQVEGTCVIKDNEIKLCKQEKLINLNDYPPFSIKHRFFSPVEISRGCAAGNCLYCSVPKMYGNVMRHRGIDNILKYIKLAVKKGYNKVWFNSPNSLAYGSKDGKTPNITMIVDLLSGIRKIEGIKKVFFGTFPGEVRPDSVNEDVVNSILPFISNDNFIVGGQSGSNRILKILRRNHTVSDVENAVDILLKYNITPKVDMIFGFYFEKPEDEEKNINFMKKIIKKGAIIHAHTFMPLPGTPLEKAPPGKLSKKIRKFLGQWSNEGKVYGSWANQEKLAKKLSRLRYD